MLLCDHVRSAPRADRLAAVTAWVGRELSGRRNDDSLRLDLLDAGRSLVDALHPPEATGACRCRWVEWSAIGALTARHADARAVFLQWMARLFDQIDRDHPERPCERVAETIRGHPERGWRVSSLAASAGVTRHHLHVSFVATFGMSVTDYVRLIRVSRAVQLVAAGAKIDALARDVGYSSKKDLYAATDRWIGVTPARLRAWSDDERRRLAADLERLARPGAARDSVPLAAQRRRRRLARPISTASVPAISAAPPTSATPA